MDVQSYNAEQHEAPFFDSGVRVTLVSSALTSTQLGKPAANFLVKISDGQKCVDAAVRDMQNKVDMGGKFALFQQSLATEGAAGITLNTMRTFGWKGDDLGDLNRTPEENGMTAEVALTTEIDSYGGKSRVRVKYVNRVDLSLNAESVAGLNSQFANLIAASKKGLLTIKKNDKAAAAPAASAGPPARNESGSVTAAAEDDIPF